MVAGVVPKFFVSVEGLDPAGIPHHAVVWSGVLLMAVVAAYSGVMATVAFHDLRAEREGPDAARVAAIFE